ncbi:MAG: serine/threonine protein kinase [Myxococcales bacterium]|nr:MAG: serine/threonine protein kinase [Myxococcales bacterium]
MRHPSVFASLRPARALLPLVGAALLSLASGCRPFRPATPGTFAELPDTRPQYGYRAASAEGVVLGISAHDNTDPHVDLPFVEKAFEQQMRAEGYALLERRDVTTHQGLAGKQFRFGHDEQSNPHLYYVTFFVTDKWVYRLEAGGGRDDMLRYEAPIAWHVTNFQPRWVLISSSSTP